MPLKKLFRILLVFLILDVLIACCCYCENDEFYFSHCDIALFHLDHSNESALIAGSSVPKEAYGIRTRISMIENTCVFYHRNSFLFPSAYASSCDCPQRDFLIDNIVSIEVFAVNEFNSEHPASSDVSEYFQVLKNNEYQNLSDFVIANANEAFVTPLLFDMFLLQPPTVNESHQFTVRIGLSDDRILDFTTGPIILN